MRLGALVHPVAGQDAGALVTGVAQLAGDVAAPQLHGDELSGTAPHVDPQQGELVPVAQRREVAGGVLERGGLAVAPLLDAEDRLPVLPGERRGGLPGVRGVLEEARHVAGGVSQGVVQRHVSSVSSG